MAKVKKSDASNRAGIDEKLSMDQVLAKVNKAYGTGTIARSSQARALSVPRLETGIFGIDYATGGGFALGRLNGIYGLKSSGKTAVALKTIASSQRYCRKHLIKMKETNKKLYRCLECGYRGDKKGGLCPDCKEAGFESKLLDMGDRALKCPECGEYNPIISVFFDAEGSLENYWAAKLGVNGHYVYVIRTEYAEQAIDISDTILRNGQCDLLVVDTLAHLIPSVEIEESVSGDSVISVRKGDNRIILPIRDLVSKIESGERDFQVRAYDFISGRFDWKSVRKGWRHSSGKPMVRIKTKYGRELKVTEDHSCFRVKKGARYCLDAYRHKYRWIGEMEVCKGSDIRIGDLMLLDNTPEEGGEEAIILSDKLTARKKEPVYVAGVAEPVAALAPGFSDKAIRNRRGKQGHYLRLSIARREGVSFTGTEKMYGRGSSKWVRNRVDTARLGYLLGAFVGDGSFNGRSLVLSMSPREIRKVCAKINGMGNLGLKTTHPKDDKGDPANCLSFHLSSRPLVRMFEQWFKGQTSRTKRIPSDVFSWSRDARLSVILGLLLSDGHQEISNRLTISTSSKYLVWDIVELLRSLGVVSSVRRRPPPKKPSKIHGRELSGKEGWFIIFNGWRLFDKAEGKRGRDPSQIEVGGGIPVKVVSVEKSDPEEVFDLEVDDQSSTFSANGILVHNSAMKWQVGVQARLINKMLRKIVSAQNSPNLTTDTRPTALLLNQVRMKVGVMWGNPETKPGGMGQDFATSIDLRMWPGKYEKDDEGNTLNVITNFRCVKNKVSPAQMEGNFRLWLRDYGKRTAGDTEDAAVVLGQALKHGWLGNSKDGWRYVDKEFKTKKETIRFLLNNRDAYEELRTGLFSDMLGTIASDKDALKIEEEDEADIGTVDEEEADILDEVEKELE